MSLFLPEGKMALITDGLRDIKQEVYINEDCNELVLNLTSANDGQVFIKDEFESDDDNFNDIDIDLGIDSDFDDDSDLKFVEVRRNKRKSLTPQRAVQSNASQSDSLENGSETSRDTSSEELNGSNKDADAEIYKTEEVIPYLNNDDDDNGDDLDNINEFDIFKDLQEETDEVLDQSLLDNVKEEWRSYWGIKCNMCEKVFPYKTIFDEHYHQNYFVTPIYTCSFCDRTLEKYSTFRSHCYRHMTESRYKCKDCSKGFSLQSLLQVHVLSKHTRAKPFKCEECGKFFVTKPGLKIHSKKHKSKEKEDYPCAECGKVLHTRGGLTSHLNVHRLGRRFMCDMCGKTFTQKVNMQQHAKQHTGDKPHECDKCGKTFAEKSHLARHYSFHSNERPFKCDVCQKMYKTERCLKVHSMVHAKERPYICSFCSKGFLSSTKLKQHYNIHTGERPYACKYCERKFTNYPNLLKHTRRRHKVDHKTGENLPAKEPTVPKVKQVKQQEAPVSVPLQSPKEEPPVTPSVPVEEPTNISDLLLVMDAVDPPSHDNLITDFTLSKTEEMLLQQGLFNFPVTDERLLLPQYDIFANGPSGNMFSPYLQSQSFVQGNGQGSPQSNDFIPVQFIQ